jgi:hypothetical protein
MSACSSSDGSGQCLVLPFGRISSWGMSRAVHLDRSYLGDFGKAVGKGQNVEATLAFRCQDDGTATTLTLILAAALLETQTLRIWHAWLLRRTLTWLNMVGAGIDYHVQSQGCSRVYFDYQRWTPYIEMPINYFDYPNQCRSNARD